eukprot:gene21324-23399_t
MHYRNLEKLKIQELKNHRGNFEAIIELSDDAYRDLYYWEKSIENSGKQIRTPTVDLIIHTNASSKGWGATNGITPIGGNWLEEELDHINVLELKAGYWFGGIQNTARKGRWDHDYSILEYSILDSSDHENVGAKSCPHTGFGTCVETAVRQKQTHPLYPKLDLLAVHVSGIPYKAKNFEKTLRKSSLIPGLQGHKNVTSQSGENGGGYSTICAARSALATCITVDNVPNLAEHVLVKRFVKGVFNRHPPTPKYTSIWDINIVLDFLNKLPDNADLSFEQLSKKFVILLLILSARRKHTLTCIHIDKIKISREQLTIMPMGNLKHSRPNWKEKHIILNRFMENPKLRVVSCAGCYIEERKKLSVVADKLIVTHKKPHRQASRDTISRWVKDVLTKAGVG